MTISTKYVTHIAVAKSDKITFFHISQPYCDMWFKIMFLVFFLVSQMFLHILFPLRHLVTLLLKAWKIKKGRWLSDAVWSVFLRSNLNCQCYIECQVKMDPFCRANESVHVILDRELITSSWTPGLKPANVVSWWLANYFSCPFLLSSFLMKSECFLLAKLCGADRNWITVER